MRERAIPHSIGPLRQLVGALVLNTDSSGGTRAAAEMTAELVTLRLAGEVVGATRALQRRLAAEDSVCSE